MPRDASGTYALPAGNPVASGTVIESDWANSTCDDLALAMSDSLDRQGRGGMLAPLRLTDGLVGFPSLAFSNDVTTGLYSPGSNYLGLVSAATEVARIEPGYLSVTGGIIAEASPGAATAQGPGTVVGWSGVYDASGRVYSPGNPPPGGGVTNPPTAQGDLWTHDGVTQVSLPVGLTDGWVLSVDSGAATGLAWAAPSTGSGEANTQSTPAYTGTGDANLDMTKAGVDLPLKRLVQGANIVLTNGADGVTIAGSAPGETNTLNTPAYTGVGDARLDMAKLGSVLQLKRLVEGSNVMLTEGADGVTIAAASGGSSPLTTKGDVYTHNGAADARLAVGANGLVLEADSTQPTGLKWGVKSSGGGGDVTGPASAVDGNFSAFNGTTGKVIEDSGFSAASFTPASHAADADIHVDHTTVTVTAGAGLTGGGTIATTLTLDVGAGDGVSVAADAVAVDGTVVRNTVTSELTVGYTLANATSVTSSATTLNFQAPTYRLAPAGGSLTINESVVNGVAVCYLDTAATNIIAGPNVTMYGTPPTSQETFLFVCRDAGSGQTFISWPE